MTAHLKAFVRASGDVARRQEFAADALAAGQAGAATMSGALRMQAISGPAFDRYLSEYASPLWTEGAYPPDLYTGFQAFLTAPGRRDYLVELRQHEGDDGARGTRPPLRQRLAVVSRTGSDDDALATASPARDLLADAEDVEELVSARLGQLSTGSNELTPARLDDPRAPLWTRRELRRAVLLARAVRCSLPSDPESGIRLALRAFGEHSSATAVQLAPTLLALDGPERSEAERAVLRTHLRAAIGMGLVDHAACLWKIDFGGPIDLVGPDGERVPLDDWLDELIADPSRHDAVATWLTQVGVPVPAAA